MATMETPECNKKEFQSELIKELMIKIHATAIVDDTATIFPNVQIDEFVIVRPWTIIGRDTIVKARATIGQGVIIGKGCFIGPHSCICVWDYGGGHKPPRIGDSAYIGTGAIILPGVIIGDNVVIAAGSVVTRNCEEPGIYMGVPCKKA